MHIIKTRVHVIDLIIIIIIVGIKFNWTRPFMEEPNLSRLTQPNKSLSQLLGVAFTNPTPKSPQFSEL